MDELLLPYVQIRDFLARAELDALLDYALSHPSIFEPAMLGVADNVRSRPEVRKALVSRDLGAIDERLRIRFRAALPLLMEKTGVPDPPPDKLELELAAHGDGAFYLPHIDLTTAADGEKPDSKSQRVLSAVFYFHVEPKHFSGGELRLFRLGDESSFVDIEPLQNSLVAFHSWMRHEVRPVAVPSNQFRDSRFAINCWYQRRRV
jgi:Rps23 Pro-64 3,4-dihydroxylase Tpa1-like proline 4-hydroxylase